jgi:2-(1,2-epoxy-1,2-dihydrophenyl)acetyl-CoA isomerase
VGYQSIILERADPVATITFNRPEARNALDLTMREELLAALDELEHEPSVRALILTGAGGHFSAGGDVKTMVKRHTAAEGRARVESLNRFVIRVRAFLEKRTPKFSGL